MKSVMYHSVVVVLVCSLVAGSLAQATLYGYGTASGDQRLPTCDDCHSGVKRLTHGSIQYYGRSYECYAAHSNGYMTLPTSGSFRSYSYTPSSLSGVRGDPLIAAYWADVDLRRAGAVYYRETNSATDLSMATVHIQAAGFSGYQPSSAVIVTYDGVGYYNCHSDKKNTFQVVMATGGGQSYLIFLYKQIQFTTGDASGGHGGLGGTAAQVGYSSANGMGSMALPGTGTSAVCNLPRLTNIGTTGVFVFRVDRADRLNMQQLPQLQPIDEFTVSARENTQVPVNKGNMVQALSSEFGVMEYHPEKDAYVAQDDPKNEETFAQKQAYEAIANQMNMGNTVQALSSEIGAMEYHPEKDAYVAQDDPKNEETFAQKQAYEAIANQMNMGNTVQALSSEIGVMEYHPEKDAYVAQDDPKNEETFSQKQAIATQDKGFY